MIRSVVCVAAVSLAVFGALASPLAASAAPRTPDQVTVSLKGADLSNGDAARAAYGRLSAAAKSVCQSEGNVDVFTAEEDRACEQAALSDALAQLRAPELSQLAAPAAASATYAAAETSDAATGPHQ